MKPPYTITNTSLNLALEIGTILGHLEGIQSITPQTELRKQNRIKTIQGSLAIEGNTLSIPQITAIIDNKRVIGSEREIAEVVNAVRAYECIARYRPTSIQSMLKAHEYLTAGLIDESGEFRSGGVGILKGKDVSHVAPPAKRVPILMDALFGYLKKEKDTHPLIKSCVFHYELMFIHPFSDGNGRVGRLWQTVILMHFHPIFEFLPIESLMKEKQQAYYDVLEQCDERGDSTSCIEFLMELILRSLSELKDDVTVETQTATSRLLSAKEKFGASRFTRKEYMQFHKTISSATASRDLKAGVDSTIIMKQGERARTHYRFV